MSKFLATVLLAIVPLLAAVDGVRCPDGCTDEPPISNGSKHAPDDGACAVCVGGMETSATYVLVPCGMMSVDISISAPPRSDNAAPDPLEHPPRA